jgi:hydrogenase expression/formation protein HypD
MPLFEKYRVPCAIAGFEPADILQGIWSLVDQIERGKASLENCYPRAVTDEGNRKAKEMMYEVFETVDVCWRGLGTIPRSGLQIRESYASFDAERVFRIPVVDTPEPKGCACGDILSGTKTPPQCALFKNVCTPLDPVGPCMVSSEGTCAAYYRYKTED